MEFVLQSTIKGMEEASKLPKIDPSKLKAMSIAETRKSLPVYAYREALLEAVKEHQVIIIVGETGKL